MHAARAHPLPLCAAPLFGDPAESGNDLVRSAFSFAHRAHAGQRRVSGAPFITHPFCVARILSSGFGADAATVSAGLLHDVVENTRFSLEDVRESFGGEIAFLVDAVTVERGGGTRSERHARAFAKLRAYGAKDPRAFALKLADRLHNMQDVDVLPAPLAREIARECVRDYAPLAREAGFGDVALALERLGTRHAP